MKFQKINYYREESCIEKNGTIKKTATIFVNSLSFITDHFDSG